MRGAELRSCPRQHVQLGPRVQRDDLAPDDDLGPHNHKERWGRQSREIRWSLLSMLAGKQQHIAQ
eukprot:2492221-Alexandrium_andersonii.AAC.1